MSAYHDDPSLLNPPYLRCIECGRPFTDANVHSNDGWRETRISGLCEDCFDAATEEDEEDDPAEEVTQQEMREAEDQHDDEMRAAYGRTFP